MKWLIRAIHHLRCLATEARPPIIGIFAIRMVAANGMIHHFTGGKAELTCAWVLLTMAVYVYNGLTDVAGDRVNGSTRPLASGELSRTAALVSCAVLAAAGVALCWSIGLVEGVTATAALLLGWAYSAGPKLKQSSLGLATTVLVGTSLTYVAGCAEAGESAGTAIGLVGVAAWVALCAPAKDFSDVLGDKQAGRKSWPVRFGAVRAARLLALTSLAALLIVVGTVAGWAPTLVPVAVVLGLGTAAFVSALLKVRANQDRGVRRRPYRILMMSQYAANVAIVLCAF